MKVAGLEGGGLAMLEAYSLMEPLGMWTHSLKASPIFLDGRA